MFFFFFFQAEDGIRDWSVTGVQTCALPISLQSSDEYEGNFGDSIVPYQRRRVLPQRDAGETPFNLKTPRYGARHRDQLGFPQLIWNNTRSEERRVGKECRSRWSPYH